MINSSEGDTLTIIMDYMMKWEEQRARESSREHYGKRGISVHGTLIKYKLPDGKIFKRVYLTTPEGDSTQDSKSVLVTTDIICKIITNEAMLKEVKTINIIADNAGTYSANIFSVAVFDIVKSHHLKLQGLIHNESQDGKTELDSSFFNSSFT